MSLPRYTSSGSTIREASPLQLGLSTFSSLWPHSSSLQSCLSELSLATFSSEIRDDTSRISCLQQTIRDSRETTFLCLTECGYWFSPPNLPSHMPISLSLSGILSAY